MKEFVLSVETELEMNSIIYVFICEKQEIKTIREKFIPIYYTKYPSELKLSRMLIALSYEFSFTRYFSIPNPLLYSE
jgi:hypothetical protein